MGAGPLQMIGVSDQLKRGRYRLERVLLQMIGGQDRMSEPLIKQIYLITL
jgi:hypothetical protein